MGSKCIADVFLLAENRLLREALVRLLTKKCDIRVVGATPYSAAVQQEIIALRPRIIVLDSSSLSLPRPGVIFTLQESMPGVRIVMVDMDPDENTFLKAVREGVVGYVLKDASAMEVAATIRSVAAGEAVCPPALSLSLFRAVSRHASAAFAGAWGAELGLSRREQQLVELLREHLTNKEIALQLNLSEQTVKNHIHNILRKVGAGDRMAIVQRCEQQLIPSAAEIVDSSRS
jgi:DNA-binding NarL/FixJ family response regulator